jgi:hypothetical protein
MSRLIDLQDVLYQRVSVLTRLGPASAAPVFREQSVAASAQADGLIGCAATCINVVFLRRGTDRPRLENQELRFIWERGGSRAIMAMIA